MEKRVLGIDVGELQEVSLAEFGKWLSARAKKSFEYLLSARCTCTCRLCMLIKKRKKKAHKDLFCLVFH